MAGQFTYGLYPWQWDGGAYTPPGGALSVLDLRAIPEQSVAARPSGYGLFAWPDGSAPPGDLVTLGVGYAPTLTATPSMRNELQSKLGLSGQPAGATLAACLADVLGPLSDPTGDSGPKPLMPDATGELELLLAGHSRVWSMQINTASLLSSAPNRRESRIRDVIRSNMDTADAIGGLSLARKALGAQLIELGISRGEVALGAPARKAQWERLLSAQLRAKHGAAMTPATPATTLTETWPNAASDIEATSQTYSWTTLNTDNFSDTVKVVSSTARSSSAYTDKLGICSSSVSSANHYAEAPLTCTGGGGGAHLTVRNAASRGTFYSFGWYHGGTKQLNKWVTGTKTNLTNAIQSSPSATTYRCDVNGSSLTGYISGSSAATATDTAITGNLQGGVWIYIDAPIDTYAQVGQWVHADGAAATTRGTPFGNRGAAFNGGRTLQGII